MPTILEYGSSTARKPKAGRPTVASGSDFGFTPYAGRGSRKAFVYSFLSSVAIAASASGAHLKAVQTDSGTAKMAPCQTPLNVSPVAYVKSRLRKWGYEVKREIPSEDGSVLIRGVNPNVSVDVYPNGEVFVIVKKGATRYFHECSVTDEDDIKAALEDGNGL